MSSYAEGEMPVIVRGSGQYVYDDRGKRYLDGLSGLFVSQIGHGRAEVAEAARARRPSSPTSRCGRTRTRGRSSWPNGWPRWRPAT